MDKLYYVANKASPIRWKALGDDSLGAVEHITPEVLVSWVLMKMMGKKPEGIFTIAAAHGLSIPFIGGLGTWLDTHAKMEADYTAQLKSGAAGVPAVYIGYYLAGIFQGEDIFRFTKMHFWDIVLLTVSKIITRPIVTSLNKMIGKDNKIRLTYDKMQGRFDIQRLDSNLNFDK